MAEKLNDWIRLALSGSVVRRALVYGIIVGTILNVINHGPEVCQCGFSGTCLVQMFLTACVPYAVSTLSSVQALMHCRTHG
jgi:hypothetical protein